MKSQLFFLEAKYKNLEEVGTAANSLGIVQIRLKMIALKYFFVGNGKA